MNINFKIRIDETALSDKIIGGPHDQGIYDNPYMIHNIRPVSVGKYGGLGSTCWVWNLYYRTGVYSIKTIGLVQRSKRYPLIQDRCHSVLL